MSTEFKICVGIDLGTSKSLIAYYNDNGIGEKIIHLKHQGEIEIPSYVSFVQVKNEAKLQFGTDAKESDNVLSKLFGAKSLLGRKFHEVLKYLQLLFDHSRTKKFVPILKMNLGDKTDSFTPEEAAALILYNLKKLSLGLFQLNQELKLKLNLVVTEQYMKN